MDIKREVVHKPILLKYWYLFPIIAVLWLVWSYRDVFSDASYFVEREKLVTAKVEQGTFQVNVRASGLLKPAEIRWVASQVAGRVEQVLVKPGAQVEQGQLLVQLSNPELLREREKVQWELAANKADNHAALVSMESQLLDLENVVIAAEYDYQAAKLKLDAETQLIAQGNATVSQLDYKRSQLAVDQQLQFWQAQQQKTKKMKAKLAATQTAQQARINLIENNLQRMQEQVDALAIRAQQTGVVQQVSLELGERAQVGDSVALIADQQKLFAELQVPEVRIQDIVLGQLVVIDTRNSEIIGKVSRIDPAVTGGMVQVDVQLTDELPVDARPELTVDALIEISNIEQTLYVKRPMFAPRNTTTGLYKLVEQGGFARKTLVKLGQSSVNKIQIESGLQVGDEIIISDTSDWQDHQTIMIN